MEQPAPNIKYPPQKVLHPKKIFLPKAGHRDQLSATFTVKLHESWFPWKSVAVYVMVIGVSSSTSVVLAFLGETSKVLIPRLLSLTLGRVCVMTMYRPIFILPGQPDTTGAVVSWHSVGVVPFHLSPSAAPFSTHFNALLAGTVNPARLQPNVTTLFCSNPVTSVLKYPPLGYPGSVQVVPSHRRVPKSQFPSAIQVTLLSLVMLEYPFLVRRFTQVKVKVAP